MKNIRYDGTAKPTPEMINDANNLNVLTQSYRLVTIGETIVLIPIQSRTIKRCSGVVVSKGTAKQAKEIAA